MAYLFLCVVFGIVSVSGKQCTKVCTSDEECGSEMTCKTDQLACNFWCAKDLPPPVIGKRGAGCNQLPMMCPQQCMVTREGCTVCDCSQSTGNKLGYLSPGMFQNSPFKAGMLLIDPSHNGQLAKNNPTNMGSIFGGSFVPNGQHLVVDPTHGYEINSHTRFGVPTNNKLPGSTGSTVSQTRNGGSNGKTLYQILMSTTRLPKPSPSPTAVSTCPPLRCIAPCDKGVSVGPDLCPICLCT